jgi:hypothetical protein
LGVREGSVGSLLLAHHLPRLPTQRHRYRPHVDLLHDTVSLDAGVVAAAAREKGVREEARAKKRLSNLPALFPKQHNSPAAR